MSPAIVADLVKALEDARDWIKYHPGRKKLDAKIDATLARAKRLDLDKARIVELGRPSPRKTENQP